MHKTPDLRRLIGDLREADGNVTFVLGAGASISAGIPLAAKLVEEICANLGHRLSDLTSSERTNYGRVMGCLTSAQREKLITPYLDAAKLNWGHIALASLVAEGKVKRVLTFNFDLILEKALALLGRHVAVYDFGMMPTKEINRLVEPSIVHLHGQGYGMKLLNSEDETKKHCENLRPLFDRALKQSTTVIFGYGGKSDPVLDIMTAEYDSRYPLYWLGHDGLPGAHLSELLKKDEAAYLGDCDFDWVMTRVAEGLEVWPPPILANPMRHVRDALAPTTKYPVGDETTEDTLEEARRRLADFEAEWERGRTLEQRALESSMGSPEAASRLAAADLANLSEPAKLTLAWRHVEAGDESSRFEDGDNEEVAREKLRAAADKYAAALSLKPDLHEALNNWGNALSEASKHLPPAEAVASLQRAGEKYEQALAIKPDKHEALNNWGNALTEASKRLPPAEAVASLQRAGEKYELALAIKPDMHETLSNWTIALLAMASRSPGDDRVRALDAAEEKLARCRELTGKTSYDLACLHALRGDTEKAVAALVACRADGKLPPPAHLDVDTDLDSIRDDPAYRAFRTGLEPPKEAA